MDPDIIPKTQESGADATARFPMSGEIQKTTLDGCRVEGCLDVVIVKSRRLCSRHYQIWQKTGDPNTPLKTARSGEGLRWLMDAITNRERTDECWLWPFGTDSAGYGSMAPKRAHVVALELDGYSRPVGGFSLHSCDNKSCVNPKHLRWGSHADNMRDAVARGRNNVKTAQNAKRLFTDDEIRDIRSRAEDVVLGLDSLRQIGRDYGVYHSTIHYIVHRKTYADVE